MTGLQAEFWHERWKRGQIGFHLNETNPNLTEWFDKLGIEAGTRVFVPLCGKSLDLLWLSEHGAEVIGVELSELAVRSFFEESGLEPEITSVGNHDRWQAHGITVIHGDFFDLQPSDLGRIDAVYDRGSLIALPPEMRRQYAEKILELVPGNHPALLITLEYSQEQMNGPPFSVSQSEVYELYAANYAISLLTSVDLLLSEPRFREKGLDELTENVYLLSIQSSPGHGPE